MTKDNFASNLISIRILHAKLWGPKVVGILVLAISKFPFGSPTTKSHLDVGPMGSHRVYYKGEGGGFPQVQAVVSLVSSSCSWLVTSTKSDSNNALTNLLFSFVQVRVSE